MHASLGFSLILPRFHQIFGPRFFAVVGRYADADTWEKLHAFGLKTTSLEEKQNYYEALGSALDPKLCNARCKFR